ncbi:MAG TPA: CAP domain-containing protein [Flavobacterium sp.]|nr:CAP domain-containing protein [Flavobacterium sp.]
MKKKLFRAILPVAFLFTLLSCSSEPVENIAASNAAATTAYTYTPDELELEAAINEYRVSIGLNALESVNYISYKAEEHNEYMIEKNVVNHDYFQERSDNIIEVLGAVKVNENVAYNYMTAESVLHAWLNSAAHKANIKGDFTHFGVSIRTDPDNGNKYYTNIFIKI